MSFFVYFGILLGWYLILNLYMTMNIIDKILLLSSIIILPILSYFIYKLILKLYSILELIIINITKNFMYYIKSIINLFITNCSLVVNLFFITINYLIVFSHILIFVSQFLIISSFILLFIFFLILPSYFGGTDFTISGIDFYNQSFNLLKNFSFENLKIFYDFINSTDFISRTIGLDPLPVIDGMDSNLSNINGINIKEFDIRTIMNNYSIGPTGSGSGSGSTSANGINGTSTISYPTISTDYSANTPPNTPVENNVPLAQGSNQVQTVSQSNISQIDAALSNLAAQQGQGQGKL